MIMPNLTHVRMAMIFNVRPDLVPRHEKQAVLDGCLTSQPLAV